MRSIRLATAGLCAAGALTAGVLAAGAPAVAAPAGAPASATECHIRFYLNQNSYVYLRANGGSTIMGLAYANDTFVYQNQTQNGFWYGRDGRAGGATGWVRAANVNTQKVCD